MKVIGLSTYGGPESLRTFELDEPRAGAGEVRVRVQAAGINPADVMLRDGLLADYYRDSTPPFVPGMDFAGTIDEIGDAVDPSFGLSIGDSVVGIVDNSGSYGAYSEKVIVPAASVTARPAGSTAAQAASFLMNALTARCALDVLDLSTDSTLLVTGAAGAVGGYVTQLASHAEIRVVAIGSEDDEDLLRILERVGKVSSGG
ncbi:NADP-dependent oxidoreductase [Rhodococcus opacus]|nr:NADP-dependent oxidoreductase [Rhodococcus opacus]